jgi:hypothetical protein
LGPNFAGLKASSDRLQAEPGARMSLRGGAGDAWRSMDVMNDSIRPAPSVRARTACRPPPTTVNARESRIAFWKNLFGSQRREAER